MNSVEKRIVAQDYITERISQVEGRCYQHGIYDNDEDAFEDTPVAAIRASLGNGPGDRPGCSTVHLKRSRFLSICLCVWWCCFTTVHGFCHILHYETTVVSL